MITNIPSDSGDTGSREGIESHDATLACGHWKECVESTQGEETERIFQVQVLWTTAGRIGGYQQHCGSACVPQASAVIGCETSYSESAQNSRARRIPLPGTRVDPATFRTEHRFVGEAVFDRVRKPDRETCTFGLMSGMQKRRDLRWSIPIQNDTSVCSFAFKTTATTLHLGG